MYKASNYEKKKKRKPGRIDNRILTKTERIKGEQAEEVSLKIESFLDE